MKKMIQSFTFFFWFLMFFYICEKTIQNPVYYVFTRIISIIFCKFYRFIYRYFCRDFFCKIEHLWDSYTQSENICFEHRIEIKFWSITHDDFKNFILLFYDSSKHLVEIGSITFKIKNSFKKCIIKRLFWDFPVDTSIKFLKKIFSCFFSRSVLHGCRCMKSSFPSWVWLQKWEFLKHSKGKIKMYKKISVSYFSYEKQETFPRKLYSSNFFLWFFHCNYLSSLIHTIFISKMRKSVSSSIECYFIPKFSSSKLYPVGSSLSTSVFWCFFLWSKWHTSFIT